MSRRRVTHSCERWFYIYSIKNTVTNKFYVGMTQHPKRRWSTHLSGMRHGKHNVEQMNEDYVTCGENAFSFQILCRHKDRLEACRMETFFMKLLRSQKFEYGYNYKDKSGDTEFAIADKWRTSPATWSKEGHRYHVAHKRRKERWLTQVS